MSRTYRNTQGKYLRRPKGKKQAKIRGSRPKAVPPDAWEDIPLAAWGEAKYPHKHTNKRRAQ